MVLAFTCCNFSIQFSINESTELGWIAMINAFACIRYAVKNLHQHISFVACHLNNDNFIQCKAKIKANDEDTSYWNQFFCIFEIMEKLTVGQTQKKWSISQWIEIPN